MRRVIGTVCWIKTIKKQTLGNEDKTDRRTEGRPETESQTTVTDPNQTQCIAQIFWYCARNQCQKELMAQKCDECKQMKPRREFDYRGDKEHKHKRCHKCRFPKGMRCGTVSEEPIVEQSKKGGWFCSACAKPKPKQF